MGNQNTDLSKFLSLVLRHSPEKINLTLDQYGWTSTQDLLTALENAGKTVSFEELETVVKENNKKRFAFSDDLSKIRANQGHSIKVDLDLVAQIPPKSLFHGTATKNTQSIKAKGILKGERQYVHLSHDPLSAKQVGSRHGKPIVLQIDSLNMHLEGFSFYLSENNVWLTEYVPAQYITELP